MGPQDLVTAVFTENIVCDLSISKTVLKVELKFGSKVMTWARELLDPGRKVGNCFLGSKLYQIPVFNPKFCRKRLGA